MGYGQIYLKRLDQGFPKGINIMIIAVDFDGTCVEHCYPEVGEEVPHCIRTLNDLNKAGHRLILWTMRSGEHLEQAVNWFEENHITLYGIQRNPDQDEWTTSPKAYAEIYIDDAALGAPLILPHGSTRPCIDWIQVRDYLNLD